MDRPNDTTRSSIHPQHEKGWRGEPFESEGAPNSLTPPVEYRQNRLTLLKGSLRLADAPLRL